MNEINKTIYIPLYGKAQVSKQRIILEDPDAEKIWEKESFPIHGKSASKWLAYNMAMRARVFDEWTDKMLTEYPDAIILHIGCGLDSRCMRIKQSYKKWLDCDLPQVIDIRKTYYEESDNYHMICLNAADEQQLNTLPSDNTAIIILEGLSMYLTNAQMHDFFKVLTKKYEHLHVLMDIYTEFGAKASKYKNPVNDVGVTTLYGIDDIEDIIQDLNIHFVKEYSFTPDDLIDELKPIEKMIFRILFTGRIYRKIYRLTELAS